MESTLILLALIVLTLIVMAGWCSWGAAFVLQGMLWGFCVPTAAGEAG